MALLSTKAIVAHEPLTPGTPNFRSESLILRDLRDDEVLVRMVATGICHTDLSVGSLPKQVVPYPRVMGHEGAGIVQQVGSQVKSVRAGAKVLLTTAECGVCHQCRTRHRSCCEAFYPLNIAGEPDVFSRANEETPAGGPEANSEDSQAGRRGLIFGQSSFANLSIVKQSSVIDVSDLLEDDEELKLFSPMGCGFQTGAGTVTNLAKVGADDKVVVMGLGGVGLAAVMAAKMQGCQSIIGIDRVASRLKLAEDLGASHSINTSDGSQDLVAEVKRLTGGTGATVVVDTTGSLELLQAAVDFTAKAGKLAMIGIPPPDAFLKINLYEFLTKGKYLIGSMLGDVAPTEYVPSMIDWYRKGVFPVDKLVKYYPVEEYQAAIDDMLNGETVKPILIW